MTILKRTKTDYEVRVFVGRYLCAFYVEAIDEPAAFRAGEDMVKDLKKMSSEDFQRYVVPGEVRKGKVSSTV